MFGNITHQEFDEMLDLHGKYVRGEKGGRRAIFTCCDFTDSVSSLSFMGLDLSYCIFDNANLSGVNFSGCTFNHTRFSNCDLTNAEFCGAWMSDVEIDNSDFTNADFYKAYLISVDFTKAVNIDKSINIDTIRLADWNRCDNYKELSLSDKLNVIKIR